MVFLNKYITIDKLKMKKNLIKNVVDNINRKYYLYNIPGLEKIDFKIKEETSMKIKNDVNEIIKNTIKNLFENDNFIYINMKDDLCTYKHKKGKNEGYICCKRITKNGNKEKYVCTIHNKKYISKKRNKSNNSIFKKDVNISFKYDINSTFKNKNKIYKNKFKRNNNKIFICNSGVIDFKNIIKKLLT